MKFNDTIPASRDNGRIRLGGIMRLPNPAKDVAPAPSAIEPETASVRAAVADSGRIRLGGIMRLPSRA